MKNKLNKYSRKFAKLNEYDQLGEYVRKRYRELPAMAFLFYDRLRILEQEGLGFCKPLTASYATMRKVTRASDAGTHLDRLEKAALIELIRGESGANANATTLRRRSIQELKSGENKGSLPDWRHPLAVKLAARLDGRRFMFGGEEVWQRYNVYKTGRLFTSSPAEMRPKLNLQGKQKDIRIAGCRAGLLDGEFLVTADYSKAEPTTIRHMLDMEGLLPAGDWPDDPYIDLAGKLEITRDEAKKKVSRLAYSRSARSYVKSWPGTGGTFLERYAEALDAYKARLWDEGTPAKKSRRRFTKTLQGFRIEAVKGDKVHKGTLLNWRAQGTMAGIMCDAVNELMELETEKAWTLLLVVHDEVYVKARFDCRADVKAIMENAADRAGVKIKVDVKLHEAKPV